MRSVTNFWICDIFLPGSIISAGDHLVEVPDFSFGFRNDEEGVKGKDNGLIIAYFQIFVRLTAKPGIM